MRQRLPNRHASRSFNFFCGPHRYTATVSYFAGTGRLAEVFLNGGRAGSDADAAAAGSAVTASLALQHGVPVNVFRRALLRDGEGRASSPLGRALDIAGWHSITVERWSPRSEYSRTAMCITHRR